MNEFQQQILQKIEQIALKLENYKNNLQSIRLKYLARSFMETLKDNARVIVK